jgi:putative ABC transport system substrate-binding protein
VAARGLGAGAGKVPRIGFLYPGAETLALARIATFREGLRATGYREPDQVELITRVTGGDPGRVGPMARELVERNVDVLVALSPAAVQAVRSLTTTIPIVAFDLETDPIGSGLVKSLARPDRQRHGRVLRFSRVQQEVAGVDEGDLPRLARIGVLWDPATGFTQLRAIEAVAAIMNVELEIVEVRALADLDGAMAAVSRNNVDALVMLSTPLIVWQLKLLADFTLRRRLPDGHPVPGFCP